MKIVILGDSLSLPRIDEGIEYEDTYPYSLQEAGHIINRSKRANNTTLQAKYVNMYNDVYSFKPDIVILHLGIVDCAPRLFYPLEAKIVNQINKVIPIVKLLSKYRYQLTKIFPKVYVNIHKFDKNISKILTSLEERNINVIIVGIADSTIEHKKRSYKFEENIKAYNKILENSFTYTCVKAYVDMFSYGEKILIDDGIHLNKKIMIELSTILKKHIEGIKKND